MEDNEAFPTAATTKISIRLVLPSCLAHLMAPPGVMIWFDLRYAMNDGTSFSAHLIGMILAIPHCWKLAIEPLVIAVLLTLILSSLANKRIAVALIVVVTILNVLVSGMLIIERSL
jgi:hypothetical protein